MHILHLIIFSLAASAAPVDNHDDSGLNVSTKVGFTYEGDASELPPPRPVETAYFLENGEQVPDLSHFPPPPPPTPTKDNEQTKPFNTVAGSDSTRSVGGVAGGLLGVGAAAGGLLGAGSSAASGLLGTGGSAASVALGPGAATGTGGSPSTAENTANIGNIVSAGSADVAGVNEANPYGTYQGDVSELPPPQKPVEAFFNQNGQEITGPASDERTFTLEVHGEGEGALTEGGNPGGTGRPGPSRPRPSQSRGINLDNFRESDKSIARHYLQSENSLHVKPFDGGRTAEERQLFADVRSSYTNLKEVKATSDKEGNFAARERGRYRYIAGTKNGKEVLIGIAEHGTNRNNFVNFTPFAKPQ
ncbi:hypothetical protein BBP40_004817 [Aspergillus hancockii]|nr:hypothetical protein BBP40_004817 [Aspergillus hancockii]